MLLCSINGWNVVMTFNALNTMLMMKGLISASLKDCMKGDFMISQFMT